MTKEMDKRRPVARGMIYLDKRGRWCASLRIAGRSVKIVATADNNTPAAALRNLKALLLQADGFGLAAGERQERSERIAPLTLQEMQALRAAAASRGQALLYNVMLQLGLRRSEVLALQLSDLDDEHGMLTIARSVGYDGAVQQLRSPWSYRSIPLPPGLAKRLIVHKLQAKALSVDAPIFSSQSSAPFVAQALIRLHWRICASAGLNENAALHTLRYTAQERLREAGAPTSVIHRVLG